MTSRLPQHVAIVMDGNGRWAEKRGLPRVMGHKNGVESLRKIIRACPDYGIKYLSVYAFSTENWKRSTDEVGFLMKLFAELLAKETKALHKEGVRIKVLGDMAVLSPALQEAVKNAEAITDNNTILQANIMLNYGSHHEIVVGIQQMMKDAIAGTLSPENVTSETVSSYLYTAGIPDPDIVIRTSGEYRLSNFLLWQSAYSEFFFEEALWPDFDVKDLERVLQEFQARQRRFGGV